MEKLEKLIELLNKYELEREKGMEEFKNWALPLWERYLCQWELVYEPVENFFNWESISWDSANSVVISKHYGFIKWLVENDKIDIDKYYEFMTNENIDISNACWELDMDKEFYYELLMMLAIQDEPIEFLISILK